MDENIVERCKAGDSGAFRQLYDEYGQMMLRTALRMLGNRQDAEDAVQSAFIKLYHSISRFEGRSALSTYLFRILMNCCYDRLAKAKQMRLAPIETHEPAVESDPTERLTLETAIDALPPKMKACFTLFAVEGLKQEEIAAIMDLSLGGVKSNIFHAKRKLRESLKSGGRDEL